MIETGYSYNDITLVPAVISNISSRSECNPFYDRKQLSKVNNRLPIFASCMSTVVSDENIDAFEANFIEPIIPRNIQFDRRVELMENEHWVAVSMTEFRELFINNFKNRKENINYNVCIDIANGHMKILYDLCVSAKYLATESNKYTLTIMTGNIANPKTYQWICNEAIYYNNGVKCCAVDYIRVSIGSGSQCTTSSNTAIHYPLATLINECYEIKQNLKYDTLPGEFSVRLKYNNLPKIVADGGIRNYSDVIKALALGADYVMIGGLFAGMYESASQLVLGTYDKIGHMEYEICDYQYTSEEKKRKDIKNRNLYKECYGMSTKKAQELIDKNSKKKTAEGKHSMVKVQYTLKQWTENMIDYLKSAMSYCGAHDLNEFIGKPEIIINSPGTMLAVNK